MLPLFFGKALGFSKRGVRQQQQIIAVDPTDSLALWLPIGVVSDGDRPPSPRLRSVWFPTVGLGHMGASRCQGRRQQANEVWHWVSGGLVLLLFSGDLQQRLPATMPQFREVALRDRTGIHREPQEIPPAHREVRHDYRCASMLAVLVGCIAKLGNLLTQSLLKLLVLGSQPPQICTNQRSQFSPLSKSYLLTRQGWLCEDCICRLMHESSMRVDMGGLSLQQIIEALQLAAPLSLKLPVLWKFDEALVRSTAEGTSDVGELRSLLIEHLGYDLHPSLGLVVRQLALDACIKAGPKILPMLLDRSRTCRVVSWRFFACTMIASCAIAPEDPDVRLLLDEASNDPEVEVRHRVVAVLAELTFPWVGQILKQLSRDPVEAIRSRVRGAYEVWESAQCVHNSLGFLDQPPPSEIKFFGEKIGRLIQEKEIAVANQNFEKAASLRDGIDRLMKLKESLEHKWREKLEVKDGVFRDEVGDDLVLAPPLIRDLGILPRTAIVAFAAQCSHRLQSGYMSWSGAPPKHFGWLHRATVLVREVSAVRVESQNVPALIDYVNEALDDAECAREDARISTDEELFHQTSRAVVAANGMLHALRTAAAENKADAARWAAKASKCAVDSAPVTQGESSDRETGALIANSLWQDYERLREAAVRNSWNDSTPVPMDFFGHIPPQNTW